MYLRSHTENACAAPMLPVKSAAQYVLTPGPVYWYWPFGNDGVGSDTVNAKPDDAPPPQAVEELAGAVEVGHLDIGRAERQRMAFGDRALARIGGDHGRGIPNC